MTLRRHIHALLLAHGWNAVAHELAELAAVRHPQSLLVAGFRLAATAARRAAADRQRHDHSPSPAGPPEIAGGSANATGVVPEPTCAASGSSRRKPPTGTGCE